VGTVCYGLVWTALFDVIIDDDDGDDDSVWHPHSHPHRVRVVNDDFCLLVESVAAAEGCQSETTAANVLFFGMFQVVKADSSTSTSILYVCYCMCVCVCMCFRHYFVA